MTKVTAITLTALVLLLASAITVSAVDMVEIRGPVATVQDGEVYTWGPQQFAGFYYDIDDNIGQESITLTITGDVLDEPDGIVYETVAQPDDFDFAEWGQYMTIGFFAENYFAAYVEDEDDPLAAYLADDSTDVNLMVDEQLSRVLYDDDEERTFTSGTPLELKDGYELAIQSIDLEGDKVYVQLMKDGAVVDSAVVEPSKEGADIADKSYTYTADLGDTEDIVIIAVHFKNAFRGADQDLATVDGIWQISDTYTDVEEDTEYDKMTIQTVNSEDYSIMMNNEDNKITLSKNKEQALMENIAVVTADQDEITAESPLRFYIQKTITEPGTYEIRGTVREVVDGATAEWDAASFAGFFYDIDDDLGTEKITMTFTGDVLDEPEGVVYETTAQDDTFDFAEWGDFKTIGFLAEEYFAAYVENEDDPLAAYLADDSTDSNLMVDEQLSKVLYDDDEERTFTSGEPLELEEGYELAIQSIDLEGDKVYVQLMKDGAVVDSAVVEPSKEGADIADKTYTYTADLGDTEDIVIIAVHFKNAFRGADQDLATVDGIWQISDTYTDVEEDTEYDKMTIQTVNSEEYSIMMNNEDNKITLSKDKDQLLMENIRVKTADQDVISAEEPLRFYIYEEATIEEEGAAAEPEPVVREAPVEEAAVEEAPVEEAPVEEAPVEEAPVEEAPVEEVAEENVTEEAPAEEEAGGIPGFEAVFAITGLLAVSYLVLRKRE